MCTDIRVIIDVARLLEFADQVADLEQALLHLGGIARVWPEVAVAPLVRRKQRSIPGQVQDKVALAEGVVLWRLVGQDELGRGQGRGVAVDVDAEGAEMTLCAGDAAAEDRHVDNPWGQHLVSAAQQDGDVKAALQLARRLDGAFVVTVDQADSFGLEGDRWGRLNGQRGFGEKRGDLWRGGLRLARPAGLLPNVGEGDIPRTAGFIRDLGKKRRLLGAGDDKAAVPSQHSLVIAELCAAELRPDLKVIALAAGLAADRRERAALKRHALFTVADQYLLAFDLHSTGRLPSPFSYLWTNIRTCRRQENRSIITS